ncbi:hypothetical protein Y032_0588g360 [Ancylostoma ceylanicum]|uniref:Uncharacterized protein n=1 Tax=Ancylostoma ceylanicum TaxID=53326 RepID=A0A016WPJ9_9BILA|nr:hypothetical protein Y032_0588g360 [Ancylostoma ceylanicum]
MNTAYNVTSGIMNVVKHYKKRQQSPRATHVVPDEITRLQEWCDVYRRTCLIFLPRKSSNADMRRGWSIWKQRKFSADILGRRGGGGGGVDGDTAVVSALKCLQVFSFPSIHIKVAHGNIG